MINSVARSGADHALSRDVMSECNLFFDKVLWGSLKAFVQLCGMRCAFLHNCFLSVTLEETAAVRTDLRAAVVDPPVEGGSQLSFARLGSFSLTHTSGVTK